MGNTDLWSTFEKTGSVMDYLSYKGIHVDEYRGVQMDNNKAGEKIFESVDNSDRDDIIRSTYR